MVIHMEYNIDYKPENKITNFCEFLTEEKITQFYEGARGKKVTMLSREHRCLKTGKLISIYNDCDECDYYAYYPEIIKQQAKKIAELEEYINEIAKTENENYEREEVYGCDGNIKRSVINE